MVYTTSHALTHPQPPLDCSAYHRSGLTRIDAVTKLKQRASATAAEYPKHPPVVVVNQRAQSVEFWLAAYRFVSDELTECRAYVVRDRGQGEEVLIHSLCVT